MNREQVLIAKLCELNYFKEEASLLVNKYIDKLEILEDYVDFRVSISNKL